MADRNIFAYTPATYPYPPYISINRAGEDVSIAVRSPSLLNQCGSEAEILLSRDRIEELYVSLRKYLNG